MACSCAKSTAKENSKKFKGFFCWNNDSKIKLYAVVYNIIYNPILRIYSFQVYLIFSLSLVALFFQMIDL